MWIKKWTGLLLTGALLAGCNQWNPGEGYDYAVYSETGDSIAAVFQTYEEKNMLTHMAKKNHNTQIVLFSANGQKTPITPLMAGDVKDLFYQEMEGYLILGRVSEGIELSDGSTQATLSYDRVELNGTITSLGSATGIIMLSCDGGQSSSSTTPVIRIIPSPDGTMLARVNAQTSCSNRSQTVTFLDAQSLDVISGPHSAGPGTSTTMPDGKTFWNTVDVAWTEEGEFVFGQWGTSLVADQMQAKVFIPGEGGPETAFMNFSCFYPPTASSYKKESGQEVSIQSDSGNLDYNEESLTSGFGCDTL